MRFFGLISGSQNVVEVGEGVELDGATDYISKSTDLVGNVDSKTFTFSAWVYSPEYSGTVYALYDSAMGDSTNNSRFMINQGGMNKRIYIKAFNSSGVSILDATCPSGSFPPKQWNHILVSLDMSNTANRKIYINDIDVTASTTWTTYTNTKLIFTSPNKGFAYLAYNLTKSLTQYRLAHCFIDYTYRDLSIEANRRLFITADGKPADWNTTKALNGILMLQMKDAATAHINDGYGGNMVQNGTLDTASRGANQDNCVASYFDGVADYLSRTSLTGVADGKQFTLSFSGTRKTKLQQYLHLSNATNTYQLFVYQNTSGSFGIEAKNSAGVGILTAIYSPAVPASKNFTFSLSVDLSNVATRKLIFNGIDVTASVNWATYTNDTIDFTTTMYKIMADNGTSPYYSDGNIGELYFNTTYMDLATSNPFWDATENKPKTVRQVIRETGVTPIIAMPLDASNAGKNYGTGGDFTVNSGPFVGARGASEFWARSAKFDGSTGYLSRGALTGAVDSKTFSFVTVVKKGSSTEHILNIANSLRFNISGTQINILEQSSSILGAFANYTFSTDATYIIMVCIDLSNTSKRFVYINNTLITMTWQYYANTNLLLSAVGSTLIGSLNGTSIFSNCHESINYFTTDYINFSQEVNRNKFVDQLGYPKDLKAQIEAGVIPKPLIYLPFDEPTNLGKNLGTGGNFTVNGTVTAGADVLG